MLQRGQLPEHIGSLEADFCNWEINISVDRTVVAPRDKSSEAYERFFVVLFQSIPRIGIFDIPFYDMVHGVISFRMVPRARAEVIQEVLIREEERNIQW